MKQQNQQLYKDVQDKEQQYMEELVEDFKEEEKAGEEASKPKFGPYAWLVLSIAVLIRVMVQWQRSIFSYVYGYTGVGEQAGSKVFEIAVAYPQLS